VKPKLFTIALLLAAMLHEPGWSQPMTKEPVLDQKRLEYARGVIAKFGEKMSDEAKRDILAQEVTTGIPPYEAYLAAGAFSFQVDADPAVWPKNADPYSVIQAQSLHPDNSRITLIFENATQFPDRGVTRFKVFFAQGRATRIEALEGKVTCSADGLRNRAPASGTPPCPR
jgi:hypothetical protein